MKIGIIGGGQLGKMTALAAFNLGMEVAIITDDDDSPASKVTKNVFFGYEKIQEFAQSVDVVTFEFENIPLAIIEKLEENGHLVRPSSRVLGISQDRLLEKEYICSLGLKTAPFAQIDSMEDLLSGIAKIGLPAILKQRRLGYDGKGQYRLESIRDVEALKINDFSGHILEGFVNFTHEFSAIVARNTKEQTVALPVAKNHHSDGILRHSVVPSGLIYDEAAEEIGMQIAQSLNLIGLLAVEMFATREGEILVNEIAPRPHNSGHWSMDCCSLSQFDLHVRAVTGLPLVRPSLLRKCDMINLIGEEIKIAEALMQKPEAKIYIYGKKEPRQGRKMGHVNFLGGIV